MYILLHNTGYVMQDGWAYGNGIYTAVNSWISDRERAEARYGHINTWDTGRVTHMERLFHRGGEGRHKNFNEPIGNWDVRKVRNMHNMFEQAESFNQALGKWQVGAVTDMSDMFQRAASFNQPLNDWDLSNVQNMEEMFEEAEAFDQDLGWCVGWTVILEVAFDKTKCESAACGVAQRDVIGICEIFVRPCLISNKHGHCIITGSTIAIVLLVLLAGFGACVYWRKKKDDSTYIAAARRVLYSCLCCCCLCCRKLKELSGVDSQLASPAEAPPKLGPEEPDEEETRAAAEETTVEESVEPSSLSKLISFLFGEREEAPTEEAPKEEEEAATLPVFAEAEEEATEQPPPSPARRWFSGAEPEPAAPKAEATYSRMKDWYNEPENAALRSTWGAFPAPDEFQAWPGFVQVTNAFLDASPRNP